MYNYLMNQDTRLSRDRIARVVDAVRDHQVANDIFDDVLSDFLGINRTDARCMDLIDREGRMTAGKLATESGLTTGAVTIVLDRLERAGYVRRVRDPADRRKVYVEMTTEMRDIGARVFSHFEKLTPAILEDFSPKQIEGLVAFLELGSLVNRAMSDVLKEHIAPKTATVADRLEQAREFERAARGTMSKVAATLQARAQRELDLAAAKRQADLDIEKAKLDREPRKAPAKGSG
jgi:DNA-binding MarR family transcriptional regulator